MARTNSLSAASFNTYAPAPAWNACRIRAGSFSIVSTTTRRPRRNHAQSRDRLDARTARHVEIQHQHRRSVSADQTVDRLGVAHRGYDLEVRLCVEQHPQATAHHGVVVSEHDRD
jgi:hypothetical protein